MGPSLSFPTWRRDFVDEAASLSRRGGDVKAPNSIDGITSSRLLEAMTTASMPVEKRRAPALP
jgi:hypothetical protein